MTIKQEKGQQVNLYTDTYIDLDDDDDLIDAVITKDPDDVPGELTEAILTASEIHRWTRDQTRAVFTALGAVDLTGYFEGLDDDAAADGDDEDLDDEE